MRFIQIVGTKGKGSTSAYVANILMAAGYKTGLFISPHIQRETERITLNGQEIPRDKLDWLLSLTTETGYFRKFYQAAMGWFYDQRVQVAVMETGMGGRRDPATRLPISQLIYTPVGMDHTDVLGDTIQKICMEKAAAIRNKVNVVMAPQDKRAAGIIRATCFVRRSSLSEVKHEDYCVAEDGSFSAYGIEGLRIQNPGSMQYVNAAVAVRAAKELARRGFRISEQHIREGLANTVLTGRQQYVPQADALVDGAHNVDSLKFLHDTLQTYYADRRKVLICASMKDKDVSYFAQMADQFDKVYASQMDYERSMTAQEMAKNFPAGTDITLCTGTEDAYAKAKGYAAEQGAMIVFAGSIYQAGEALDLFER